jgi:FkbM family methyltransferase
MPDKIVFRNGKTLSLSYPNEKGIKSAFLEIFFFDSYHLRYLKASSEIQIRTIIDIGGNVGFFSIFSRDFFPEALIHCYEPNPILYNYLNHNSTKADFKVFYEAVGKSESFVSLENNTSESIMGVAKIDNSGKIKMISFKEVLNRVGGKIDLLKLDCEGAEWQILEDYESMRNVYYITLEYHLWAISDGTLKKMYKLLEKNNFRIIKVQENDTYGMILAKKSL